jgi:hypothetical protein
MGKAILTLVRKDRLWQLMEPGINQATVAEACSNNTEQPSAGIARYVQNALSQHKTGK